MAEIYKKIDDNTLEITRTSVQQYKRKYFEDEKQKYETYILKAQKYVDKINVKLAVLDKEIGVQYGD